jgi:hypothetical protein
MRIRQAVIIVGAVITFIGCILLAIGRRQPDYALAVPGIVVGSIGMVILFAAYAGVKPTKDD